MLRKDNYIFCFLALTITQLILGSNAQCLNQHQQLMFNVDEAVCLNRSDLYSCFISYEKLPLPFIKFLQHPEGSRTDVATSAASNLRSAAPENSDVMHGRPLC